MGTKGLCDRGDDYEDDEDDEDYVRYEKRSI